MIALRTFFFVGIGAAFAAAMWAGILAVDSWIERRRAQRLFIAQRLRGERP